MVDRQYKRCTKCGRLAHLSMFADHKYTLDGHQSWCRRCKRLGMRRLRADRKEGSD